MSATTVASLQLSILDQSPIPAGSSAPEALAATLELARLADQLGYSRYWLAEHHNTVGLAGSSPEVLIARVAAETQRIRVGSGGVMLSHYSPLKVAETFRVLHALYPGRIDLGIGRAPGSSGLEAYALQTEPARQLERDDFGHRLMELLAFLRHEFKPEHSFSKITVSPDMPGVPELWMLGSSGWSADAAAQLGLAYAAAHFINPETTRASIEQYKANFQPKRDLQEPAALICVG